MDGAFPLFGHAPAAEGGQSDSLGARLHGRDRAPHGRHHGPAARRVAGGLARLGLFLLLAAAASLAQLFVVTTTRNQIYHTTAIFVAGVAPPPEFVALLALVSHIPDWLRTRYPWYIRRSTS